MCVQVNNYYNQCTHRTFKSIERCQWLGISCLGPSGHHRDEPVDDTCSDCKTQAVLNRVGRGKTKDPWGKDDPWARDKTQDRKGKGKNKK
jgi:hypothetical protein